MTSSSDTEQQLSTWAFARALNRSPEEIDQRLATLGLILRHGDTWDLTPSGKSKGGQYRQSKRYGRYIVWPDDMKAELDGSRPHAALLTATAVGKHFDISASRANSILSELGWIKRGVKGWVVTVLGQWSGGLQSEDKVSGVPYVRWPESIVNNKTLVASIQEHKGDASAAIQSQAQDGGTAELEFREKFVATHRATDGHNVRSKAELLIDNWLYMAEIVHAYERKLPVEEEVYSDFYIPTGKVYVEYWGFDNDPRYSARKQRKLEIYKKYGFQLIQLTDKEVQNLDDALPKLLLRFGVRTE